MISLQMVPDGMMMPGQTNVAYIQSRGPVPSQFIRQNTPSPQPSPVGMNPVCVFHLIIQILVFGA